MGWTSLSERMSICTSAMLGAVGRGAPPVPEPPPEPPAELPPEPVPVVPPEASGWPPPSTVAGLAAQPAPRVKASETRAKVLLRVMRLSCWSPALTMARPGGVLGGTTTRSRDSGNMAGRNVGVSVEKLMGSDRPGRGAYLHHEIWAADIG